LLPFIQAAVLAVLLFTSVALMAACLVALSRIASRRFLRTLAALFTGASAGATLFRSLIAITIVCHTCSSPLSS
jgi:hypothetical protein